MSLLTVVILLFFACDVSIASSCPTIVTQVEFNITQYAGVWYEVYRHDIDEVASKCENETFTANSDGTMTVWNQGVTQLSGYYSHRGLAVAKNPTEPAAFIIHLDDPVQTIKYNIITTDYNQYSLIFSCDYVPLTDINFQHIWILSRTKTLSSDILKKLREVLKEMHARADEIEPTPQNC